MDFDSFQLVASTPDLSEEPAARPHADVLEFRMDLAADPLAQLQAYEGDLDILVTNRPAWEGGDREEGPDRRDELLEALEYSSVSAVDLELRALEYPDKLVDLSPVREAAAAADISIVVSKHDFERTPSRQTLVDFAHRGCQYGSIAKLAVTPTELDDVLTLLQATLDLTREGRTVATMAMGASGSHSRAIAPIYGSKLGYAPVSEATAPGQLDLQTLASLVDTFGGGGRF